MQLLFPPADASAVVTMQLLVADAAQSCFVYMQCAHSMMTLRNEKIKLADPSVRKLLSPFFVEQIFRDTNRSFSMKETFL